MQLKEVVIESTCAYGFIIKTFPVLNQELVYLCGKLPSVTVSLAVNFTVTWSLIPHEVAKIPHRVRDLREREIEILHCVTDWHTEA